MRKPLYSTLITVLLVLFILFKVCYKNILQLKKGKKKNRNVLLKTGLR